MAGPLGGIPGSFLSSGKLDVQALVLATSGACFCLSLQLPPPLWPNVGLILLHLRLSLHLLLQFLLLCLPPIPPPWLHLASVVFLRWSRHLFCIRRSWSAPAFRQFLRNLWARSWPESLLFAFHWLNVKWTPSLNCCSGANFDTKKPQVVGWWHNQLVRGLFSVLPYFILPFPASLGRFAAISAAYPPDSPPVRWFGYHMIGLFANTLL